MPFDPCSVRTKSITAAVISQGICEPRVSMILHVTGNTTVQHTCVRVNKIISIVLPSHVVVSTKEYCIFMDFQVLYQVSPKLPANQTAFS